MKKIDRIRMTDEKTSIMLNGTSPVKINIPFIRRRPAQKRVNLNQTSISNISIRNAKEDKRSIAPSIFTTTIKIGEIWSL